MLLAYGRNAVIVDLFLHNNEGRVLQDSSAVTFNSNAHFSGTVIFCSDERTVLKNDRGIIFDRYKTLNGLAGDCRIRGVAGPRGDISCSAGSTFLILGFVFCFIVSVLIVLFAVFCVRVCRFVSAFVVKDFAVGFFAIGLFAVSIPAVSFFTFRSNSTKQRSSRLYITRSQ